MTLRRKAFVIRQESTLVLKSSIINEPEYSDLKNYLLKHETVDAKTFVDDKPDETTEQIIRYSFSDIVKQSTKEWRAISLTDYANKNCSLCNQPNKIIYYIKNKINGNTLNVGSSCVTYFENELKNDITTESFIDYRKRVEKDIKLNSRKVEFMAEYPDINKVVYKFTNFREHADILLPKIHYEKITEYVNAITQFKGSYLSGKINHCDLITLHPIIKACIDYIDNIVNPWIDKNRNNPFICTDEANRWFISKKKEKVVEALRANNSTFDINTICEYDNPKFLEKHISDFKTKLSQTISSLTLSKDKITVYVTLNKNVLSEIVFFCNVSEFIRNYGQCLFVDIPSFTIRYCLSNLKFQNSVDNIYKLTNSLNSIWYKEYEFLYDAKKYCYIILSYNRNAFHTYNGNNLSRYIIPYMMNKHNSELFFKNLNKWEPFELLETKYLNALRRNNKIYMPTHIIQDNQVSS